jgi:hypothetical protein
MHWISLPQPLPKQSSSPVQSASFAHCMRMPPHELQMQSLQVSFDRPE